MRLIVNSLVFDTEKSEKLGTIPLESDAHKQSLYRTPHNRYFFVIEEFDVHPVYRRLIPTTAAAAKVWLMANEYIINRPVEKPKDHMVTTFLSPGNDEDYQLPHPIQKCMEIPLKP